jgi:hypothetical protein
LVSTKGKATAYFDTYWPEIAAGHETKWDVGNIAADTAQADSKESYEG